MARDDVPVFRMPSLGADMESGTVVEWRVHVGDSVKRGDVVAVIATDKSDLDAESFQEGIVAEILVGTGAKVPVGTPLLALEPAATTAIAPAETLAVTPATQVAPGVPTAARVTSPVVRHLAEHAGVDTTRLVGSGVGGRITRDDVERAATRHGARRATPRARRLARRLGVDLASLASAPQLAGTLTITGRAVELAAASGPSPEARVATGGEPPGGPPGQPSAAPVAAAAEARQEAMRTAVGRLMARSWQEIPHYRVDLLLDLSTVVARLAELNETRDIADRIIPAAALTWATARAARDVPAANGEWVGGRHVPAPSVELAVVVALRQGGLLAPVITAADQLDLAETMRRLRDLVSRARSGRLRASEVTGATLTVTNLGEFGADSVTPIIHPPQVGIVGFGAIRERPWAEGGMLGARPTCQAVFAGDHRASDGRTGSMFLTALAKHLATIEEALP